MALTEIDPSIVKIPFLEKENGFWSGGSVSVSTAVNCGARLRMSEELSACGANGAMESSKSVEQGLTAGLVNLDLDLETVAR